MKKILLLTLLAVACAGYSQGTVNFNNLTNGINAPISYAAGTTLGDVSGTNIDGALHPTAQAALYAGPDGATEAQLVLIAPAAGFGSNELAGYVEVGALSERVIPLVAPGGFAMVQVRAWDANDGTTNASYEAASLIPGAYLGKSIVLRIATTGAPDLSADLVGLNAFTIRPGTNQTITFDPLPVKTFGDPPFALNATADSGLSVSYTSSDTNVAAVLSNIVTILSPGTTVITASQEGDTNFFPATPVEQLLTVIQAAQAITFAPLPTKTFGDPSFMLEATASSGLPVSYTSSDTNVATVLSNVVTILSGGTTTITASQEGDANYFPAVPVEQLLTVVQAAQAITFDPLPAKTFGDPSFMLEATASSGLPVSYTSSDTNVATVVSNIVTILSGGTTVITASQEGDTNYFPATPVAQLLTVDRLSQTITFDPLLDVTFGDPPFELNATADSGLPVSYTSSDTNVATVASNVVTILSGGTTTITASQEGDANYFPAVSVEQLLTVSRLPQTITFDPLFGMTFGDPPFELNATADSGLPVSYTSSDTNVATVVSNLVTILSAGTTTITASQEGDINYLPATPVEQLLTVSRLPQTITFDPLFLMTFGDPPFELNATADSGLPVSYTSSDTNVATVASNIVTILSGGTTTITASQEGDINYFPAVPVEQLLTVDQASQELTFDELPVKFVGDPPFALAVTVSSGLPVSFTSSDTNVATVASNIVTILRSGNVSITASQAGDARYYPQAVSRLLTIAPAPANNLSYVFTTLAGRTSQGNVDGVGDRARFFGPGAVARDSAGNLYVAENGGTIRKITPAGVVSTVAGFSQTFGSADGLGSNARFRSPTGIAVDGAGVLYVTDAEARTIRKITPDGANWVVSTIAGSDQAVVGGNDGPGGDARFLYPQGIAVDGAGCLYVTESASYYDFNGNHTATNGGHVIRKLTPEGTNWIVSTIAGLAGSSGTNDGVGSLARFYDPFGIAVDGATNVYVADSGNQTIRKLALVGADWVVTTIAGQAGSGIVQDGIGSEALFAYPFGITVDGAGDLYVSEAVGVIRKMTLVGADWEVTSIAGQARIITPPEPTHIDGTGTEAVFNGPYGLVVDGAGNFLYVADSGNNVIRQVTTAGVVSTFAGAAASPLGSADGTGGNAQFYAPSGIAVDLTGNVYVADSGNSLIRRITAAGVVSTLAGPIGFGPSVTGSADGTGNQARFNSPSGIAVDSAGNLYVADTGNNTIRKVTPVGVVSTIAGLAGESGSADGLGGGARFFFPFGIAVDGAGHIYVADSFNFAIRKLTPVGADWEVTTIATGILFPNSIAVDSATNLYVLRTCSAEELEGGACEGVTKITPVGTDWVVSQLDPSTAGGAAIAVDGAGNIFLTTANNQMASSILKVSAAGTVSVIGGMFGVDGNLDGTGSAALFDRPGGIAVDSAGDLYIADTYNNTIRKGVFRPFTPVSPVPYTPPAMDASLTVMLSPPEANGQWRFPWEFGWRNSGVTVSNLVTGNYPVEFRAVEGWLILPLNDPVAVPAGTAVSITNEYYPTLVGGDTNSAPGSLTVFLGVTPPAGAGWRFLGESTPFLPHAFTTNLLPGTYLIEFAFVSNRVKPPSQPVRVVAGQPSFLSVNYPLAPARPAGVYLPFPVPANLLNDEGAYPFGFNGQLQSENGYGSGVAVDTHVVLTAAHLVFNDATLAYAGQAYWFFRRDAGITEPLPQAARSYFVLSGYAARRTNDFPVPSTPQSRNLDVAALYFSDPVAGGGHGGYLPSDATPNTWLSSPALKMLVGYPVDGSQFGDASIVPGKMYQTEPQPFPLSLAGDSVPDSQQVYVAPWFLSYPGNSGGPLYVQLNGSYYPAGVYLGTLFNGNTPSASAVRAIDRAVVNLITNAAALGASGTNFTGGGVVNIIPSAGINASHPGYVQFRLAPPAAVAAGAGWRLQGDTAYSSANNYTRAVTSTNAFAVEFKPILGWNSPGNQNVFVSPGQLTPYTAFYSATNPVLAYTRTTGLDKFGMTGTTGTVYRLEKKSALTNVTWLPVTTNTIRTTGFNPVLTNPAPGFYRLNWLTNF